MNRLKELRQENNLTLKELGKQVNMLDSRLSQYENGLRNPKKEVWEQLANYYNVSVPYLQGAYSKEEILKVLQESYKKQFTGDENPSMTLEFLKSNVDVIIFSDVEEYLIAKGVVSYDVPKINNLLDESQVNDFSFWQYQFKDIFNTVSMVWLTTKPSLEASTDDIKQALAETLSYNISKIVGVQRFSLALNKYYDDKNGKEAQYQESNLDKRNVFLQNLLQQRASKPNSFN